MARRAGARRYSQAVFQIAVENSELDKWQSDLDIIAQIGRDTELLAFLDSPRVPFGDKRTILAERLGDIGPLALNMIYILINKSNMGITPEIADEYRELLNKYRGIEEARVTTAIPLDDADRQRLAERLSTAIDKEVVIESEVDTSLIGGIITRIGGKLLDGSTRGRLAALKREISRAGG
jgi:F-type H+-transporting ATPase subunit delta